MRITLCNNHRPALTSAPTLIQINLQSLTSFRTLTCFMGLYRSAARSILVRQCPPVQRKSLVGLSLTLGKVTNQIKRLNYTWINQDRKSVQLPAPTYIDYVMTWVQNLLDDENTFPTKSGNFALSPSVSASHIKRSCTTSNRPGFPCVLSVDHQACLSSALACIWAYLSRALSSNPSFTF